MNQPAPHVNKVRILHGRRYLRITEIVRDQAGRIISAGLAFADRRTASRIDPYTAAELADACEDRDGPWLTTEIA